MNLAILTALPKEHAAVRRLLQNAAPISIPGDTTLYTSGTIPGLGGNHEVIVACLSKYANNPAAITTTNLLRSFPTVQDIAFVGIAAGVPRPDKSDAHVRLGDVIVSSGPGVIQFDLGTQHPSKFEIRDASPPPSARLLQAVNQLESEILLGRFSWADYLVDFLKCSNVKRPKNEPTKKFRHPLDRKRQSGIPRIFRGKIGASNTLMKSAVHRDDVAEKLGILAIEMEGSGVADASWEAKAGYILIRSACDYGDEGKDDSWQEYAAHAAAAYLGALFSQLPLIGENILPHTSLPLPLTNPMAKGLTISENITRIHVSPSRLTCCTWLPDESLIVVGSFSGSIHLVSATNEETSEINLGNAIIRCVATFASGPLLITGDDLGRLLLVDSKTGTSEEIARSDSPIFCVSIWEENQILYSAEKSGLVVEWAVDTRSNNTRRLRVVHRHDGPAFSVCYHPETNTCWSVGADGLLLGTDLDSGQTTSITLSDTTLFALAIRSLRILAGDSKGRLFSRSFGQDKHTLLEGHIDAVRKADLSLTAKWIATASKDGTLRFWHLTSNRSWIIAESRDYLYDAVFSPSNTMVIACDGGGDLIVVRLGQPIDNFTPAAISSWLVATRGTI